MQLITVDELETSQGKKWKTDFVNIAIQRLSKKRDHQKDTVDNIFNPFEVLLECAKITEEYNKKIGNKNASK
jgi:hypothetical protein